MAEHRPKASVTDEVPGEAHFSQSGSNVLDLCSGTGSTTIAALSLGRNAFSVETDREMRETLAFRVANLKAEMDAEAKEKEEFKSSGPEVRKIKKKLLSKKKGQKSLRRVIISKYFF